MAHYALLNEDNIVTQVITGIDEGGDIDYELYYSNFHNCTVKRTSYNTARNEHKEGGTPFRGNYAGVGYTYDTTNDGFYPPKPYDSWSISEETNWVWTPPVPYPDDGNKYIWDEETTSWVEV